MKKLRALFIAIIIGIFGVTLSACAPDYSKLQISASYTQSQDGVMSLSQGQTEKIIYKLSNMPNGFDPQLSLSLSSNKVQASIEKTNKSDGTVVVNVTALSYGDCILRATTNEGGKFVDVQIKVELAVQDFALKGETKLFLVKGTNNPKDLLLDNSCFSFSPAETTQTQINWYDDQGNQITKLSASEFAQTDVQNIKIYAKSPYLDKTVEVDVEVIDEIKTLEIYNLEEITDGENVVYEKGSKIEYYDNQTNVLQLVTNKSDFARKYIRLYVTCGKNELLKNQNSLDSQNIALATTIDTILQGEENFVPYFDISLQALREGQTTVNFEVYYDGYSGYKISKSFVLDVVSAPEKILVNDVEEKTLQTQILYDNINSTVVANLGIGLVPNTAVFDKIEFEFDTNTLPGTFEDYVSLTYAGEKVLSNTVLTNLSSKLLARGIKSTEGKEIYLILKLYWGSNQSILHNEQPIEYKIKFEVKTGASVLYLQDEYADGQIFVDIEQGSSFVFDGFYVKEIASWTDGIEIYNISSQNTVEVSEYKLSDDDLYIYENNQVSGKKIGLLLQPKQTGVSKYSIYLPNGVSRMLTINVVKQPQSVSVDVLENQNITEKKYNSNDLNLSLMLEKKNDQYTGTIQLSTIINGNVQQFVQNNELFNLDIQFEPNQALTFDNDIIEVNSNFSGKILTWQASLKKVENFKLVDDLDTIFEGTIQILAFVPIETVQFSQTQLSLYSKSDLGINYKDEAKAITQLTYNPSVDDLDEASIEIVWSSDLNCYFDNNILSITNYGTYNTQTGEFELDITGTNPSSFYVYATIKYNGQVKITGFQVIPQHYTQVTGIRLNNFIGSGGIYLSPTNDSFDIYTYVLPTDAVHQELLYTFEPDTGSSTNIVKLETLTDSNGNNLGVKVSYGNNGGGSGQIVVIAKSTITDQSQTPQSALYIPISVGDGSYLNPYKITTADEFLAINKNGLDKHYVVENTIDLSGYTVNFDKFTGTIDGKGIGKIVGVTIASVSNGFGGLFSQIGKKDNFVQSDWDGQNYVSGQIKNITFEGSINLKIDSTNLVTVDGKQIANIGFVCGELLPDAVLQNVRVVLKKSSIQLNTTQQVNIGGVVGKNNGQILSIVDFDQDGNLFQNINVLEMDNFEICYTNLLTMSQSNPSSIGGIAGLNDGLGKIARIFVQKTNLVGDDNYFAKVNLTLSRQSNSNDTNQMYTLISSIAGTNKGIISALESNGETTNLDSTNYSDYIKTTGKILINAIDNCTVGGLVAQNSGKLQYCVTRTKIWVQSDKETQSTAFVGGIYGRNLQDGTISNCVIQALEDISAIGINATLIYSKGGLNAQNQIDSGYISVFGKDSVFADTLIFANGVNNLKATTYIGEKLDDQQNTLILGRKMVEPYTGTKLTVMTSDNYYGDIFVGQYDKIGGAFAQQKFDCRSAEFVVKSKQNCMVSETGNQLVSFVYFKQAKNSDQQQYLEKYNQISLPFEFDGEVSVVSFDSSIIKVQSNGMLNLLSTGLCKLRITSVLNTRVYKDVYIYVINEFDQFNLYQKSNKSEENIIIDGGLVVALSNQNISLFATFTRQDITINGFDIEIIAENQPEIINIVDDQNQILFNFQKIGNVYVLKSLGLNGTQVITLKLCLNITIDGDVYSSLYTENGNTFGYLTFVENDVSKDYEKYFVAKNIQGATDIKANRQQISMEPSDTSEIVLKIDTDNFDEQINLYSNKILGKKIDFIKYKENFRKYTLQANDLCNLTDQDFDKLTKIDNNIYKFQLVYYIEGNSYNKYVDIYINIVENKLSTDNTNYFDQIVLNLTCQNFKFAIFNNDVDTKIDVNNLLKLKSIEISYNIYFDTNLLPEDYAGQYYLTFETTSTQISTALQIDVLKQQISTIIFESFKGATSEDIDNGEEQTPYINPGEANHFRINVVPAIADFDYITLTCSSEKFLMTLIDENGNTIEGVTILSNGIKVDKSLIQNQVVYAKYTVGSLDVENGQTFNFQITAYKDDEDIYKASKQITIKFAKDVTLQIKDKQKFDNAYYLTRGTSYDFVLGSYGYLDDEIVIQTNRSDLISIDKQNQKITITSDNITYQSANALGGVNATITVYGKKYVDGDEIRSNPDTINVMIVEYTILENKNTIVNQGSDGIVNVSMGDYFTFDTKLISGLNAEYNASILELSTETKRFTDSVTQNAVWEYQIAKQNGETYYFDDLDSWKIIDDEVTAEQSNNNFIIKIVDGKIRFFPLKTNSVENSRYRFRLSYGYEYKGGVAVWQQYNASESRGYGSRQEIFQINVYQLSSIDTPSPVSTEKELMSMQDGVYYILTDDITLSSQFVPINKQIAGLDGNGKKIVLTSNLSAVDQSNFGLFEKIYDNTLVRNLTIEIANSIRITLEGSSSINFGFLAGENNGIITNCVVQTVGENSARVVLSGLSSSNAYVGCLVGENNGYISNSRVNINITSSSNLAGFACVNNGKISSSCVNQSLLINTSTDAKSKTAGFVCNNSGDKNNSGVIITSYVSGSSLKQANMTIYANDLSMQIKSSTEIAGFVYQNEGKISDCYSNIPLSTSSKSAGFVFKNIGDVYNCFSTSMLKNLSQESYGFVYDNSEGTLSGCLYLSEQGVVNYSINTSNTLIDGLSVVDTTGFADKSNFETYSISDEQNITNGNWFFPSNASDIFNNQNNQFINGRLELVSANIISASKQQLNLDATVTNEETGEVTYVYENIGDEMGSVHNPYIITSAERFEEYVINSSSNNTNTKYFRLVCDIDYQDVMYSSMYDIAFAGDIEGNGMYIKDYVIDNLTSIASAGLFAKVGNGISGQGCIKNVTLCPKYINLPNAVCVGGLAGTLDGGTLCNVNIIGVNNNSSLVVLGKNIVGGLVGRAINDFDIKNCTSSISANSTYRSKTVLGELEEKSDKIASYFLIKSHSTTTMSKTSYAGCIAGVLAGTGKVNNVSVNENVVSIAEFAGLLFGGIGNGVTVENIQQSVHTGQYIQAAVYGGIVAGESYGRLNNIVLSSTSSLQNFFRNIPFTAYAVGGIVGLLGDESNLPVLSRESVVDSGIFDSKVQLTLTTGCINTIGGLVGELLGGKIQKSGFEGSVYGYKNAGGLIGAVVTKSSAEIKLSNQTLAAGNISNKSVDLINQCFVNGGEISVSNDNIAQAKVGGFVGYMLIEENSNGSYLIKNSYNRNKITVKSDFYGTICEINAGGLIGEISKKSASTTGSFFVGFEDCFADCLIELNLRDLKENIQTSEKYQIYYGEIVGCNKHGFDISYTFDTSEIGGIVIPTETSVKFAKYSTNTDSGHTINLSYYKDGSMKNYQYKVTYKQDGTWTEVDDDNLIVYTDLLNYSDSSMNAKVNNQEVFDFSNTGDIGKFFENNGKAYYLNKNSNIWTEKKNGIWTLVLKIEQ